MATQVLVILWTSVNTFQLQLYNELPVSEGDVLCKNFYFYLIKPN